MEVGDSILNDTDSRLQADLRNKDFKEVSVAQALLEAAQKKISEIHKDMQKTKEQQRSVAKRKQSMLDTFLSKPSNAKSKKCVIERQS